MDGVEQGVEGKRLGDVIVGAELEAEFAVVDAGAGGKKNEGDMAGGTNIVWEKVDKKGIAGKRLVARLSPTWDALNLAARNLDTESGGAAQALLRLEAALGAKSLIERVRAKL